MRIRDKTCKVHDTKPGTKKIVNGNMTSSLLVTFIRE